MSYISHTQMFDGTETVEQRASVNESRFHPFTGCLFKILVKISINLNSKSVWFSFLTLKITNPVEDFVSLKQKCSKPEWHPQVEPCEDWNFTRQAVKFFEIIYCCKIVPLFLCWKRNTFFALKLEHSDVLAFIVFLNRPPIS